MLQVLLVFQGACPVLELLIKMVVMEVRLRTEAGVVVVLLVLVRLAPHQAVVVLAVPEPVQVQAVEVVALERM